MPPLSKYPLGVAPPYGPDHITNHSICLAFSVLHVPARISAMLPGLTRGGGQGLGLKPGSGCRVLSCCAPRFCSMPTAKQRIPKHSYSHTLADRSVYCLSSLDCGLVVAPFPQPLKPTACTLPRGRKLLSGWLINAILLNTCMLSERLLVCQPQSRHTVKPTNTAHLIHLHTSVTRAITSPHT